MSPPYCMFNCNLYILYLYWDYFNLYYIISTYTAIVQCKKHIINLVPTAGQRIKSSIHLYKTSYLNSLPYAYLALNTYFFRSSVFVAIYLNTFLMHFKKHTIDRHENILMSLLFFFKKGDNF